MLLCVCAADLAYAAIRLRSRMRLVAPYGPMLCCYVMCGTELPYDATWCAVLTEVMLLRGVRY
eukprot:1073852-Rhodomonas_salina.3